MAELHAVPSAIPSHWAILLLLVILPRQLLNSFSTGLLFKSRTAVCTGKWGLSHFKVEGKKNTKMGIRFPGGSWSEKHG